MGLDERQVRGIREKWRESREQPKTRGWGLALQCPPKALDQDGDGPRHDLWESGGRMGGADAGRGVCVSGIMPLKALPEPHRRCHLPPTPSFSLCSLDGAFVPLSGLALATQDLGLDVLEVAVDAGPAGEG